MYYITTKLPVMYHNMTFEEFMSGEPINNTTRNSDETATRTEEFERISEQKWSEYIKRYRSLINPIKRFNDYYEHLFEVDRSTLYRRFYLPKKSGGLRPIDEPVGELMDALRELKTILESNFGALYHTNAYAYIKKRSTVDLMKRHQFNESRWFGKYDLSNFFGSTTYDFVISQLEKIYPFCCLMEDPSAKKELCKALSLAFLNGGLPQGTPLSPMLTNLVMIPIDYKLTSVLLDYHKQHFVYTRYADDFQISSKYDFSFREIEKLIVDTLAEFGAPFTINSKKTRYGSSAGQNWNLGLMLNKDNQITVGYKKKRQLEAMVSSYVMDRKNGIAWSKNDIQVMDGLRNYYHMVEGVVIDNIINHLSNKFNVDIMAMIQADLRGGVVAK